MLSTIRKNCTKSVLKSALSLNASKSMPLRALVQMSSMSTSAKPMKSIDPKKKLLSCLDAEIKCCVEEEEINASFEKMLTEDMKEFLQKSGFKLVSKPRTSIVTLEKNLENEKIVITANVEQVYTRNDSESYEEEEISNEAEENEGFDSPIDIEFSIEKQINGETRVMEGSVSLNGEWTDLVRLKMRGDENSFDGPDMSMLDDELSEALVKQLEAKGINEDLYMFLDDFMEVKESSEYLNWLEDVRNFIKH